MIKTMLIALSQIFSIPTLVMTVPDAQKEATVRAPVQDKNIDQLIEETRILVAKFASNNRDVLISFDTVADQWRTHAQGHSDFDIQKLLNGVAFAAKKHEKQTRDGAVPVPYIVHPIGVAKSLWEEAKVRDVDVLTAALLHDTLEDTRTGGSEIGKIFGSKVRRIVEELTNDPKLSSQQNKQKQIDHAPMLSSEAKIIKLADRLYNVRDLRKLPEGWGKMDILRYLYWGDRLLSVLKGTNSALEKALEREILDQLAANKL